MSLWKGDGWVNLLERPMRTSCLLAISTTTDIENLPTQQVNSCLFNSFFTQLFIRRKKVKISHHIKRPTLPRKNVTSFSTYWYWNGYKYRTVCGHALNFIKIFSYFLYTGTYKKQIIFLPLQHGHWVGLCFFVMGSEYGWDLCKNYQIHVYCIKAMFKHFHCLQQ